MGAGHVGGEPGVCAWRGEERIGRLGVGGTIGVSQFLRLGRKMSCPD